MKQKQKLLAKISLSFVIGFSIVWVFYGAVQAAVITGRSMTLSNSAGAATSVSYTLASAALPTTTAVGSVSATACTAASGACTTPTGFSIAAATLSSQPSGLGAASGWTVDTGTAGSLRIVNAANVTTSSGAVSIAWGGVVNPTANDTTFYIRITTYSDSGWSTPLDTGTVAVSTATLTDNVSLAVDEILSFCVYTGANCAAGGTAVNLGTASTSTTSTGTSKFDAATNATGGYAVTVNGATLTSGGNTVTAITAGAGSASSTATEQFGINLLDNATPNIGTDPSGAGGYSYGTGYGTVDAFKFVTGNTVVSMVAPALNTTYTVSYIANITAITEPGAYTATMTYICTAIF